MEKKPKIKWMRKESRNDVTENRNKEGKIKKVKRKEMVRERKVLEVM